MDVGRCAFLLTPGQNTQQERQNRADPPRPPQRPAPPEPGSRGRQSAPARSAKGRHQRHLTTAATGCVFKRQFRREQAASREPRRGDVSVAHRTGLRRGRRNSDASRFTSAEHGGRANAASHQPPSDSADTPACHFRRLSSSPNRGQPRKLGEPAGRKACLTAKFTASEPFQKEPDTLHAPHCIGKRRRRLRPPNSQHKPTQSDPSTCPARALKRSFPQSETRVKIQRLGE